MSPFAVGRIKLYSLAVLPALMISTFIWAIIYFPICFVTGLMQYGWMNIIPWPILFVIVWIIYIRKSEKVLRKIKLEYERQQNHTTPPSI